MKKKFKNTRSTTIKTNL